MLIDSLVIRSFKTRVSTRESNKELGLSGVLAGNVQSINAAAAAAAILSSNV